MYKNFGLTDSAVECGFLPLGAVLVRIKNAKFLPSRIFGVFAAFFLLEFHTNLAPHSLWVPMSV